MASNYEQLVKALRVTATFEYTGKQLSKRECALENLAMDAADAIEALQADLDQWEAAVKGQEDGIKVLQAEVERLQVDLEAAYALMEVQDEQ